MRIRSTLVAAVVAILGVIAAALPADAANAKIVGYLDVNGTPVPAIQWNSWLDAGQVDGIGRVIIDQQGGGWYSGSVSNKYIAGRHVRYRCTLTYGPADEQIVWQTSRYWIAGGTSKSWNWGRVTTDKRIALRWNEIWAKNQMQCGLFVG